MPALRVPRAQRRRARGRKTRRRSRRHLPRTPGRQRVMAPGPRRRRRHSSGRAARAPGSRAAAYGCPCRLCPGQRCPRQAISCPARRGRRQRCQPRWSGCSHSPTCRCLRVTRGDWCGYWTRSRRRSCASSTGRSWPAPAQRRSAEPGLRPDPSPIGSGRTWAGRTGRGRCQAPATGGADGSPPAPPPSRRRYSSMFSTSPWLRWTMASRSLIELTSSTCSLMNHCMNWSEA